MRTRVRASLVPVLVLVTTPVLWLALEAPILAEAAQIQRTGAQGATSDEIVVVPMRPTSLKPETYGTVSAVVRVVGATEFAPPDSGFTWTLVNTAGNLAVQQTSTSGGDWWAAVTLPAGAILNTVELDACDTTSTGEILFGMAKMNSGTSSGINITGVGSTGSAATPGCGFFPIPVSGTQTVDNRNNTYLLFMDWSGDFTSANKVFAFRVFYHLQVSPTPATATFADVPVGHPQHRFVEALAAAGITGGCGGGNYCPTDPLTRGQMAVFLSVALGLHFPN